LPTQNKEKPCLVETGRGFSILYKDRFLYSKYAPEKNILTVIQSLQIYPGTLILACSPCLGFGLSELSAKIPAGCYILGCECDTELYHFAKEHIKKTIHNFSFLSPSELAELPVLLNKGTARFEDGTKLLARGTFRRAIRIDFSAGIQFNPQFYCALSKAAEDAIGLFWKNRITLVKLGRKYSRNLFRNISRLPESEPIEDQIRTVAKPIVVLGAGESMENTAKKILPCRNKFYLAAADAAVPPLLALGIVPDAVICEEAQIAIAPAFFGIQHKNSCIFAGITSWPGIYNFCGSNQKISYFATKYDDTLFFDRLQKADILPLQIPPLGSVGLTAVYIALLLRINDSIPIFISGLDFSYTLGQTHTRGAPAHTARLYKENRTLTAANYDAAFGYKASTAEGKDGRIVYTMPALMSYAHTFRDFFSDKKNVFDAGLTGITLGLQYREVSCNSETKITDTDKKTHQHAETDKKQLILQFYDKEEKALTELKNILSHGQNTEESIRNKRILELLTDREYLYLHFPDGYKLSIEPSFLKRIRTEIDFFLKDIHTGKKLLPR
jgi:hypothetical protein